MSAPFALPDLVQFWNEDESVLLFDNVPARVVPCFRGVLTQLDTNTNTRAAFMSHWVDFDELSVFDDGATRIAAVIYALEYDAGPIIVLSLGDWVLKLRMQWLELRYTSTPNYYHRAWCSRMFQGAS